MKEFFRRNLLYFVVAAIILFGIFKKKVHTENLPQPSSPQQAAVRPIEKTPQSPSPQLAASQIQPTPSFQPTPIVTQTERKKFLLQDPFCLGGKKGFVILPSIYLSEFYTRKTSWIALPQSYAKCFAKDSDYDFYFFEFSSQHQLPYEPLVKMPGRVTEVKLYDSYADLKKENLTAQYDLRNQVQSKGKKPQKSIFEAIEREFNSKLVESWVQITISAQNLEEKPSYWPYSPVIHPVAQILPVRQFNGMLKNKSANMTLLDVRSKKSRKAFPLPFESTFLKHRSSGYNDHVITNLSKLAEARIKGAEGEFPQSTYVLIGSDPYDYSPYNTANLLAMKGIETIYILEGGASTLGGPNKSLPNLTGQGLSPDQLRSLMKSEKNRLAVIDCRPPASTSGGVPGSIHPPVVPAVQNQTENGNAESDEQEEKVDIRKLKDDLLNKHVQYVVLYGMSRVDQKPSKVYGEIQTSQFRFYQLEDGIKAWSFYAKYKWPNEGALVVAAKNTKRNHAPPERRRVNPQLKPGNTAAGNKGVAAGTLKARPVTEAQLNEIKNAKPSGSADKNRKKKKKANKD